MSYPNRSVAEIHTALGEMIVTWNLAESMVRFFVIWFYGLGDKGDILTAHMGSRTLGDAMTTLTEEFAEDAYKPHFKHFLNYLETLRAYRNFYAHGIAMIGFSEAGEPVGLAQETQARGKLTLTQQQITVNQIKEVTVMCKTLHQYGSAILSNVLQEDGAPLPLAQPLASLEKPPLPAQLSKRRISLTALRHQPQASEG